MKIQKKNWGGGIRGGGDLGRGGGGGGSGWSGGIRVDVNEELKFLRKFKKKNFFFWGGGGRGVRWGVGGVGRLGWM